MSLRVSIYMRFFVDDEGWHCQFFEENPRTALPRTLTFPSANKMTELVERAGGVSDLESRQEFEHELSNGVGGVHLKVTLEQYARLKERRHTLSDTSG